MDLLQRAKECIERAACVKPTEIQKAAMTTTNLSTGGGLLAPQQADTFIRMLRMQPYFLRACRLVPLKGPTDRLDRIGLSSRFLHAASENTALAANKQTVPDTSKVEMSAKLFKGEMQISYETLQDSIEGGQQVRGNSFENTIFQLISERCALDIEEFTLKSETGHSDPDLAQFNGFLKLAESSHSYDHGGAAVSKTFFKKTFLELPQEYRQRKSELVWVVSSNLAVEWEDELADKGNTEFSQRVAWGDETVKVAYGIPLLVSHAVPSESGTSSNIGKVLLSHPKNMIVGIWRDIMIEVDRDIRAGSLIIVVTTRVDGRFEQVEGAAVGKNLKVA